MSSALYLFFVSSVLPVPLDYSTEASWVRNHVSRSHCVWSLRTILYSSLYRIRHLRAFAHIPKQKRKKLDAKARKCVLVEYSEKTNAHRLLDRSNGKIIISRDVQFIGNERSGGKSEITFDIVVQNIYNNRNFNHKTGREPTMARSSEKKLKSQELDQEIIYFPISDTKWKSHPFYPRFEPKPHACWTNT